jgi:DNA phosphorothioation-dependent restriction protein DptH
LELLIEADATPASLVGTIYQLFDWTGVTPTGVFDLIAVQPGTTWDTSNLYATGEVTLLAVPEPGGFVLLVLGLVASRCRTLSTYSLITLGAYLRFYLDKAHRHYMDESVHNKFLSEIDKLLTKGSDYRLSEPSELGRGFVFCPELNSMEPVLEPSTEGTQIPVYLFGPSTLPDFASAALPSPSPIAPPVNTPSPTASRQGDNESKLNDDETHDSEEADETANTQLPNEVKDIKEGCLITLGKDRIDGASIDWHLSIASNPHLMLVGLPGMGKTTALLSICNQLIEQGVTSIVFSYHQDIDERMESTFEKTQLFDPAELGFNPMQVSGDSSLAYIDNAGQLRDIFVAMYPDLGDIQLDKIRKAIKDSYVAKGWGQKDLDTAPVVPEFREFFQALSSEQKPDRGLMARLEELDDYEVFSGQDNVRSLLDLKSPTILKIHATQNENMQRAFAMLAFYNIYKEMFQRGPQDRITHVVVFDEAHRASRMKLLPTFAKESRKYGISLLVSSQEAKDFDTSLFSAIANYALLRLTEADARRLAKNITTSDNEKRAVDRLKTLQKYQALFFSEGSARASHVELNHLIKRCCLRVSIALLF